MMLFHEVCHWPKTYLLIDGLKLENGILKEVDSHEINVFVCWSTLLVRFFWFVYLKSIHVASVKDWNLPWSQEKIGGCYSLNKRSLSTSFLKLTPMLFEWVGLLTICLLLLQLWESVIVLCFVVRYFMASLVFQSSCWERASMLLCLVCLPGVSWWLCGSSSRCHGVSAVCDCGISWLYLLIIF